MTPLKGYQKDLMHVIVLLIGLFVACFVHDFVVATASALLDALLMEEILHPVGCIWWDKLPTSTGSPDFFHKQYVLQLERVAKRDVQALKRNLRSKGKLQGEKQFWFFFNEEIPAQIRKKVSWRCTLPWCFSNGVCLIPGGVHKFEARWNKSQTRKISKVQPFLYMLFCMEYLHTCGLNLW